MATYISDSSDEFGRSVAQSKLETKVRADFELTGFVRDWILIVRPFQKIMAEHSDIMVQQGVMTREEAVHWLNMHWELICAEPKRVAAGCALAAYGRERQTRAVVHVKQQSFVGYSRIRLKAETFVLPRSGAGEDEVDLDDLTMAGVSQRRAIAPAEPVNPETSGEAPPGGIDLEDFPFAGIEVEENEGPGRANREWGVGEVWAKVDFDDEYYEAVLEFWGVLKDEKHAEHLEMAEAAAGLLSEEDAGAEAPGGTQGEDAYTELSPGEPFGMAGVYRLRAKKQGIHQPGAKNFLKGRSELEHPNPQALIDQYAGTGQPKQTHRNGFVQREVVSCHKVIGMYFEKGSSVPKPTTRFMIHYSPKTNQAHIVPARPRSDDEDEE